MSSAALLVDQNGNTIDTPVSGPSSLDSIFGDLTSLGTSITQDVLAANSPTTLPSLSPTPTAAQPYPVTSNGTVVGYSAVPVAGSGTVASAGISATDLFLLALVAAAVYFIAK